MVMDDHDWLDQRLASGGYVPDDGFTARVLDRASAKRARSLHLRRVILMCAAVLAGALVLVQSVALARSIQQLRLGQSISDLIAFARAHATSVGFDAGVAAVLSLVALGVVFASRRWS